MYMYLWISKVNNTVNRILLAPTSLINTWHKNQLKIQIALDFLSFIALNHDISVRIFHQLAVNVKSLNQAGKGEGGLRENSFMVKF